MDVLWTLADPLLNTSARTYWVCLLVSAAVALVVFGVGGVRRLPGILSSRSSLLDVQLLLARQLLGAVGMVPVLIGGTAIAVAVARSLGGGLGTPQLAMIVPSWMVAISYAVAFFVAWDASRFLLHLAMHRVPALWSIHQVHHSAEVLTPLTIHRVHPVESFLYAARGAVVTGVLGGVFFWLFGSSIPVTSLAVITGVSLALNAVFGNLRHSHVWWRFGRVERWLISPAQHQLHHADDESFYDVNFGVWLSVWDRWAGTWVASPEQAPMRFGLGESRNHEDTLVSAWIDPVRDALRTIALKFGPRALWKTLDPVAMGKRIARGHVALPD
ncbi:MAG: sterol desaturase/sphingolipid hydroxylase (fatty acid hydroxylase superfamily) [Myxococcota bacterium]|jgi:sterol desaturase/sphingolipid hydroxylase (fatty acid hydroxylase superfamily)